MSPRVYQLKVPAEAGCLKAVRAFVASILESALGAEGQMVVLALDEACANIVKHRTPRVGCEDIEVRVEVEPELVRFRIGAFCAQEDLPRIRPRDLAELRPGGLGTHFIGQIMDRIEYEAEPDRPGAMALVLEKRVPKEQRP
ncbi:MAG: ATP-binding protein [Planctomycetes bacterium]|nr:ATP-binding protein [Planctomycetota bacterium]